MEIWQWIISGCAGIITLLTFLDKIGLTKKVKTTEDKFNELTKMLEIVPALSKDVEQLTQLHQDQNQALLAILRNELYRCFKENREFGAWTDSECGVQTKMHNAYKSLKGNGEEELWWKKKELWAIVSDEDFNEMVRLKTTH